MLKAKWISNFVIIFKDSSRKVWVYLCPYVSHYQNIQIASSSLQSKTANVVHPYE